MGLRPLYAGTIHGTAPFLRRGDIWVWALYTQGCWPGIMYIFGSLPRYTRIWPGIIYIHTYNTKHIYMCVHMSCLSHARVVPMLDVPTVPRVWDQWPCVCLWRVYIMTVGCCDLWLGDTGLSPGIDGLCRHDRCDLRPWYSYTCLRFHTSDSHIILALMLPSFLVDYLLHQDALFCTSYFIAVRE